jgi:hypothetical protein
VNHVLSALTFAQRALCAAAILLRPAAEMPKSDLPVIRQQERLSKNETFKLREGGNRFALALEHPFW